MGEAATSGWPGRDAGSKLAGMNNRIDAWQLQGHTALITGASKGIGYAVARELAGLGANLLLVARDDDHLEQVRVELADDFDHIEVLAFAADLSMQEDRLSMGLDDLGQLRPGSLLQVDGALVGATVGIMLGGRRYGEGTVVRLGDWLGVRIAQKD